MRRSRWLIALLTATGLLVIMAVGAYFLLGRELFQRPFLVVAVLVAWLGALVGFSIASESGQGMWRGFSIRRSNHTVKSKGGHDG